MADGGQQPDPAAVEAGDSAAASQAAAGTAKRAGGQAGGCIILADSRASVPVELITGLSRRGMAAAVLTDTPTAMVRLARQGAAALLIADGTRLPGHDDLLEAVRRYHPHTGCWAYVRTDAGIRLHRLGAVAATPEARNGRPSTDHGRSVPPTRPTGRPRRRPLDDLVLHLPDAVPAPHEPLVTEEELAMLLGGAGHNREP